MPSSLKEIAEKIQGTVLGDATISVSNLSPIDAILPGTLVFADDAVKVKLAEASEAAAILVSEQIPHTNKPLIQVKHPKRAFVALLAYFNPPPVIHPGIHPSAVIAEDVQLGKGVFIGPYVCIEAGSRIGDNCVLKSHIHVGHNVSIGANTTLHSQVTIYDNTEIGSRVTIHASTVIGSDGFGYDFVDGKHVKVPHVGRVVVQDDVEIGVNTAIDRATLGATVIGEGTKIDNLVQVAHSVKLGKNNILCGFTGIAGSSTSGDNVIFAADVGVSDHVRIDSNVILGARTGVPSRKHLREGHVYLGNPARPRDMALKQELAVNRIPALRKAVKTLTEKVARIMEQLEKVES